MRFFNEWGDCVKRYDPMKVRFIYIPEELFEEAKTIFSQFHRTFKSQSSNGLYYSSCMELKPVNCLLEEKENFLIKMQKEVNETKQLVNKIIQKINK
jgi:hypothetical protein